MMAENKEGTFRFVVVGGGIAGVTCAEQVSIFSILNSSFLGPLQ